MTLRRQTQYYRERAHTLGPDGARAMGELCDEIDRLRAERAAFRASLLTHLPCAHCGQDVCATDERGKPLPDGATCESCRAEHVVWTDDAGEVVLRHDCDFDHCGYDELGEP